MAAALAVGNVVPVFAATGVTNGNMKIGGSTASISTIQMNGNRTFEIMVANDTLDSHQSGKSLVSKEAASGEVVAAVNGGFFSLRDWSVCNTMVQDGRLIAGGGWSNAVGITYDGQVLIDQVKLSGVASVEHNGKTFELPSWSINMVDDSEKVAFSFLNEYCRENVKVPAGGIAFFVENGKVKGTMTSGIINPMPHQDVIVFNAAAVANGKQWDTLLKVGDSVSFGVSAEPVDQSTKEQWNNVKAAMGGAVMLVRNGQNIAYENDYSAADQAPTSVRQRVFVAKMASGELIMGTVNSSYVAIAQALSQMGAVSAMAMDGGSSSMLYSNGSYLRSAGRELTMGLAVVDEAQVSRIPNAAGIKKAVEIPENIFIPDEDEILSDAERAELAQMESFFNMVDQRFNADASGAVAANGMLANTSVTFAANSTKPAAQTTSVTAPQNKAVPTSSEKPGMRPPTSIDTNAGGNSGPSSYPDNISGGNGNQPLPQMPGGQTDVQIPPPPKHEITTPVTPPVTPPAGNGQSVPGAGNNPGSGIIPPTSVNPGNQTPVTPTTPGNGMVPPTSVNPGTTPTPPVNPGNGMLPPTSVNPGSVNNWNGYAPSTQTGNIPGYSGITHVDSGVRDVTRHPGLTSDRPQVFGQQVGGELAERGFADFMIQLIEQKANMDIISIARNSGYSAETKDDALVQLGIMPRKPNGGKVSRKQAAVSLTKAHQLLSGDTYCRTYKFKDTGRLSDQEQFAISYVVDHKMMEGHGYKHTQFEPDKAVTMTEMNAAISHF